MMFFVILVSRIPIEIFENASDEESLIEEKNLVDVPLPQSETIPSKINPGSSQIHELISGAQISEEWSVHVSIQADSDLNERTQKCFNFRHFYRRIRERFF